MAGATLCARRRLKRAAHDQRYPRTEASHREQPPVRGFRPSDAKPSQLVFGRFIGVFAGLNIRWRFFSTFCMARRGDARSAADLLTQADVQPLLVIEAYRDNEVDPPVPDAEA